MSLFFVISIIAVLGVYLIILHKMQKYVKYFFTFILLLILIVPNKVSAKSSSSKYTIENYNIDMVVNENNREEYFVKTGSNIDKYPIAVIIFCALCVLIADRLWAKYGKEDEVLETIDFYPPKGFNSAEVGSLYYGAAEASDYSSISPRNILSLLIYLANKGYLSIEEREEQEKFKKVKSFRIKKIREYDGDNEYEKLFFNGLFENKNSVLNFYMEKARKIRIEAKAHGEKISSKEAIRIAKLSNDKSNISISMSILFILDYTLDLIRRKLNVKKDKSNIFESSSIKKGKWLSMMIIAISVLITVKPLLKSDESGVLAIIIPFQVIGFTILINSLIGGMINLKLNSNTLKFFYIETAIAVLVPLIIQFPMLLQNIMYLIMYIIGLICIAILLIFAKIMPKKTPYGNEILGKIRGFKKFLETVEKPQLESLVAQNPDYFYDILPYAYALGVFDLWINKFENISLRAPNWYDSTVPFNIHSFREFITKAMDSATSSILIGPKIYFK